MKKIKGFLFYITPRVYILKHCIQNSVSYFFTFHHKFLNIFPHIQQRQNFASFRLKYSFPFYLFSQNDTFYLIISRFYAIINAHYNHKMVKNKGGVPHESNRIQSLCALLQASTSLPSLPTSHICL